jgi:hypothetical protein
MLPFIVITAAILFFVLQRSGIFEDIRGQAGNSRRTRRRWGERVMRELERDPELNKRLEVFKDFLDNEPNEPDEEE